MPNNSNNTANHRFVWLLLLLPGILAGCMSRPTTVMTSAIIPHQAKTNTNAGELQFPVRFERFKDDRLNRNAVGTDQSPWTGVTPIVTDGDIVEVFENIVIRTLDAKGVRQGASPLVLKGSVQVVNVGRMGFSQNVMAEVAIELSLINSKVGGRIWSRGYRGQATGEDYQSTLAAAVRDVTASIENDGSILAAKTAYLAQGLSAGVESSEVSRARLPATGIDNPEFAEGERILGKDDFAVITGIEKYQGLPASEYSSGDALLVKDYFLSLGIPERNIEILLNERATLSGIRKTVESWLPNVINRRSRVFFYFSGHGAPEPQTGESYLVSHDGDPNYLPDTGYQLKRLYDRLGRLEAREVVVLLDSCFSGAGGRSILAKGARPLVMTMEVIPVPGNMAVMTASEGTQISTSSPEKKHGIFTYFFLKSLKEGKKSLAEIYEHISPLVQDEARRQNIQQKPSLITGSKELPRRLILRK